MHKLGVKRVFYSTGLSLPLPPSPAAPLPQVLPPLPADFIKWERVAWGSAKVSALVAQLRESMGGGEGEGVAAYTTHSQKLLKKGRNAFKR